MALCKTNKGTLYANSYGNHWYDNGAEERGVVLGIYNDANLVKLKYDESNNSYVICIDYKGIEARGIKIEEWER